MKNVVTNIYKTFMDHGRELNDKQQSQFVSGYFPEIIKLPELGQENTYYFQDMIGILRWSIYMVLSDVAAELSLLSRYITIPLSGNLDNPLIFSLSHVPRTTLSEQVI